MSTGAQDSAHQSGLRWSQVGRRGVLPLILLIVLGATVGVNLWWIFRNLRGMPFNIDTAGYLQRAVRDGDALRSGGIAAYVSTIRTPGDFQAPLLTALGGFLQHFAGFGVLKLTASLQLFYVITVISSYSIARRLLDKPWSVLAAIVVASVPAILQVSRDYEFAGAATGLFLMTLAVQLRTKNFDRIFVTLAWGMLLGLCSLTRTVMLALLPALPIMSIPRILIGDHRLRRFGHLAAGCLLAVAVALTWYSATWRPVLHYLTTYGYGAKASGYGVATSWLSLIFWTRRISVILNADVFLPLALALVGSAIVGVLFATARHFRCPPTAPRSEPADIAAAWTLRRRLLEWAASDTATILGIVVISYIVLCSSPNGGAYFELPILPLAIILLLRLAHLARGSIRTTLLICCVAASGLTFANQAGWLLSSYSDVVQVTLGSTQYIAFDERGVLIRYASEVLGGCPEIYHCLPPILRVHSVGVNSDQDAAVQAYLKAWLPPVNTMTTFVETFARARDRYPILFFAVQDPFFNTNTVALEAQLGYSSQLPIGLLNPFKVAGTSYLNELNEPQFGEPNFVVEGPLPGTPNSAAFSPDNRQRTIVAVLRRDRFRMVDAITLPDGRTLGIWWKDRGATFSG